MFSGGLYGDLPNAKDEDPNQKKADSSTPWKAAAPVPNKPMAPRGTVSFVPTSLRAPAQPRTKETKPQQHSRPQPPLPSAADPVWSQEATNNNKPALAPTPIGGIGHDIEDEYDPAYPNDYIEVRKRKEQQRREAEAEAEVQERMKAMRQADVAPIPSASVRNGDDGSDIALQPEGVNPIPSSSGQLKGMGLAQKMMEKMGWKEGKGLGRNQQGISAPLLMKKTDARSGVIVSGEQSKPQPSQAPPPTRVVLLENVVGRGQVDESLDEEIGQECSKFGEVLDVLIFEMTAAGFPDDQAVRIFVEFETEDSALKAYNELNGRYFGGRIVRVSFYDMKRYEEKDLGPQK